LVLGKATNHKVEVFKVFGSLIPSASHHWAPPSCQQDSKFWGWAENKREKKPFLLRLTFNGEEQKQTNQQRNM
jgi:hypothetical protein